MWWKTQVLKLPGLPKQAGVPDHSSAGPQGLYGAESDAAEGFALLASV